MSRIGIKPIAVPAGVNIDLAGQDISVTGPKGKLSLSVGEEVNVSYANDEITVSPRDESRLVRSKWGLYRSLIANLVTGVTEGFEKRLEITGVGYRAQMKGKNLGLQLGYSHDIDFKVPDGIKIECPSLTSIIITGIDKQQVGQAAAEIRAFRKPEPYKGKGIRYAGEYIYRKEGKKK